MLVTYKFSKRITIIKGKDMWIAKEQTHVFFSRFDLIDQGLLEKLITDYDSKFFNKFWTEFFNKFKVKLFYSTTYYPQTNGSNKKTNQTIETVLHFFVYALENPAHWLQVFSSI